MLRWNSRWSGPLVIGAVLAMTVSTGGENGAGSGWAETSPPALSGSLQSDVPETDFQTESVLPTRLFDHAERFEDRPAGIATVERRADDTAFSQPSRLLKGEARLDFELGNALFRKLWIAAPASTKASDGLGPFYNARSCESCHRRDGRGHLPGPEDKNQISILLRLSVLGDSNAPTEIADWLATSPHPVLGGQLQDFAAPGLAVEGKLSIRIDDHVETLPDGTQVTLYRPVPSILIDGKPFDDPALMTSLRIAPQMIGLGLLEAIPEADLHALADPDDANHDGISGRVQIVPSVTDGRPVVGRFGWKAGSPDLRDQTAAAFLGDLGLSTPLYPLPYGDCTAAQKECRAAPNGQDEGIREGLEVESKALNILADYARNLGVPARSKAADPTVLLGKARFYQSGCTQCHTAKHVIPLAGDGAAQNQQVIWPYTDLLLHDMGPGLADNRPEGRATGQEWRTPPLWGIGLTEQVSGRMSLLHDGRAGSFLEAILWHGGEANAARAAFVDLPRSERDAVIAFLESL